MNIPATSQATNDVPLIRAENVCAGYGSRQVLRGLSLELGPGELIGLVGPNGSGKTTLLHCLTGYHPVAGGTVTLTGRPTAGMSRADVARIVAFVPQQTDSVYSYSVLEMVLMGRHPFAGLSVIDSAQDIAMADSVLAELEISHLSGRDFSQLSGGEKQMVLLARAFVQQAPVLMLDEPLTGLDVRHQFQLMSAIRQQCDAGDHAALATFHDLGAAARWCSRMILLRDGKIIDSGAPTRVITAENLAALYDVDAQITTDLAGHLSITVSGVRG